MILQAEGDAAVDARREKPAHSPDSSINKLRGNEQYGCLQFTHIKSFKPMCMPA